jgi:hypothetical protein
MSAVQNITGLLLLPVAAAAALLFLLVLQLHE